ncbi:MAG: MFS transporter [Pyrinomonadaceae bacterium]|nr:MFS transporter [Pyrinomonadaceae bacterium]
MADEQTATLLAAEELLEAETVSDSARGVAGWWKSKGLGRQFLTFLAASSLFDFGMSMFFLLYNLYLLDLGYREDFLGLMSSFSTAGSVTGTLLAVFLNRRVGLKRSVILCVAGMTLTAAVRSVVVGKFGLLGFTFAYGMCFGIWAVSFAVVIAQITTPAQRPFAYSIYIAILIGLAMIADPIAGRLPRWLNHLFGPVGAAQSKRWVLLLSCGIVALAVLPALRLQLEKVAARARKFYPRSSFIVRFLIALALLHVATSCFGPFASAYFARFLKLPVETIGFVFSGAQLAQVIAILLSPLILRRFGLIWGVVIMEGAAGLSLAILATGPAPIIAAFAFAGFMAFQYMDEPAMDTLLMSKVETHERSGASALMFLTIFASGAVTAPVAGVALTRFGYRPVILGASLLLLLSAFLFGALLRERSGEAST